MTPNLGCGIYSTMALWQLILIGVALLAVGFIGGGITMAYVREKMDAKLELAEDVLKASYFCRAAERLHAGDLEVAQEWLDCHLDMAVVDLGRHFKLYPQEVGMYEWHVRQILNYRDSNPSRLAERGTPEAVSLAESLKESLLALRQLLPSV